jgi:hypothetical protein
VNKTIKELSNIHTHDLVFEVINPEVQEKYGSHGFKEYNSHSFKSKHIIVTNLYASGFNFSLTYLGEDAKATTAIVVPPDFLLKQVEPSENTKALIEKYHTHQLDKLGRTCRFEGKIGSDPEIFCESKTGKIIPAFAFLPSKENPIRVPGYADDYSTCEPHHEPNGSNLYWDGFQAEFTTKESDCMGWHGDSIQAGLRGIFEALRKHKKTAVLSTKTVIDLSEKDMESAPKECLAFGCNASLNAYGMNGLQMPGDMINYRSAGGHIHLSFKNVVYTPDQMRLMVKAMDAILGVAGVSMCAKYDDPRRRIMYGLAGEYRLPPHGLEYRVLSNAWLIHPVLANIVFDLARTAAMFGVKGLIHHWKATEQETIECINTCNVDKAREILKRNEDLFKKLLRVKLDDDKCVEFAHRTIMNGLESVIAKPEDIVGNWGLTKAWRGHCDGVDKNVHYTVGSQGSGKDKI